MRGGHSRNVAPRRSAHDYPRSYPSAGPAAHPRVQVSTSTFERQSAPSGHTRTTQDTRTYLYLYLYEYEYPIIQNVLVGRISKRFSILTPMTGRSDDAFIPGTSIPLPSTQANDTAATVESKSSPLSKRVAAPCIEAAESEAAAAKDGTPSPLKKRKTATSDGRVGPQPSASGRAELDAYIAKLAGPAGARAEEMAGKRRELVRRASQDLEKLCIKTLGETTELQDAFRAWDLDHSGYIDRGELTLALKRAGRDASEEVVTRQMKEVRCMLRVMGWGARGAAAWGDTVVQAGK